MSEQQNFLILVEEFKQAFDAHNLSFTVSFSGKKDQLVNALDYAAIQKHVDFIQFTVEPTHRNISSIAVAERLSLLNYTIENLIELGVPQMKIIIGIKKYCGFERDITILARHNYDCRDVDLSRTRNTYKASECIRIQEKILQIKQQCIEFESARSIANQVRFLMKRNIAGFMVFAINYYDYFIWQQLATDTFKDFKSNTDIQLNIPERNDDQYPLLKTIYENDNEIEQMKKHMKQKVYQVINKINPS